MVDWETLTEWRKDWFSLDANVIEKRLAYLQRTSSLERFHLTQAVITIRYGRERLLDHYAYVYADQLAPDSSVGSTPHLDRLLELAVKNGENRQPDPQRWFEALSLFDQAVAVSRIENEDPYEKIGRDLDSLIDFLRDRLFVGGFEKIDVYSYHDPNNGYTVHSGDVSIDRPLTRTGLTRRKSRMTCRRLANNHIAYMHHRIKDPFQTLLKMHRQQIERRVKNPFNINDRCGLMFAVPTVEELQELALNLLEILITDHAVEIEPLEMNHETDHRVDVHNQQSSVRYKVAKMLVEWRGRKFEFQFVTFPDYFTSLRSFLESNHELYKLRQAMNYFLPLIWPECIYEVDWSNPHVRHTLRTWKEAQLGWRVNGDHKPSS